MKLCWGVFLFFSLSAQADNTVSVRLQQNLSALTIQAQSLDCCFKKNKTLGSDLLYKIQYSQQAKPHWLLTNLKNQSQFKVYEKVLNLRGQGIKVNQVPAPDHLKLHPIDNKFDVVAHVELEKYLQGVLPAEMPAAWPIEALKAQAIASRSYTLAVMQKKKGQHFHVESTVRDQVYDLKKISSFTPHFKNKVNRAINETKGYVLENKSGEVHKSFFHADCGGQTEEPNQVWDHKAANGTAKDPYCPSHRHSKWNAEFSHKKINQVLQNQFGFNESDVFEELLVVNKSPSGRVKDLKVKLKNKEMVISAQRMREAFGFSKMKSTFFEFKTENNRLKIKGRGNGHGVGLCQWGAKHWALKGKKHQEILKHYYPIASLSHKQ